MFRLKLKNIKNYQHFEQVFIETLNEYALLKEKFLTENTWSVWFEAISDEVIA